MFDKDLGNVFLVVGKVHCTSPDSLDSLASLASALMISRLTIKSKYEHKYRGIWTRIMYKEQYHWKMKPYAF